MKIERDLDAIVNWLKLNRLFMNYDKVCYLVFGNTSYDISLKMNILIKRLNHVKVLGCMIDDKLN